MKRILLFLLIFLVSCGSQINPNVPLKEIAGEMNRVISNGDKLSDVDADYIRGMLGIEEELIDEFVLYIQTSGTEIDQYGIFKISDSRNFDAVKTRLQNYLTNLLENFDNFNYMPEERVKLKEAEVTSAGQYLIYTVMSESDKTAFMNKFNEMTK
ncbi:MAG: DUF4358 domain-containing protein [Oscillospiraceae bacterium]|nr:DUF4358 domain-containing protein [Oscillospiraceae bacterium]